ncbi:MAG TPA: glycoside hydrolase family 3 C-terminal domain-containing protein [Chitinophagaceae bacterium]|nr:glycoside hydrolase family 3 C-terminal domain-containing protein [Chitinophagaceae bacterium]
MNTPKTKFFLTSVALILLVSFKQKKDYPFPFLDPDLSIETRVNDLVGRMTLDEKIGQMMNDAPAIDRLHIPKYNWWNECLHGVARAGLATVFPQAIGLGATWDEDMMLRVSTAISDEARAKHHEFVRKGERSIYEGLTFWTPNINIFRDPRWGRGQETYGEDPYLTGRLAVQFIKGLQGDDPKYFKTIATVKHFAVHSGPESNRHTFDAKIDEKDFRETYLPQFEMGIKEGKAYSVMCAYNRLNGEACCGSNHLLTDILRNEWNFKGYVVSDCGAIDDIYQRHKIVETPGEAAALAVKSGCDLECLSTYQHLKEAVANKLITEAEIDVALKRLFTARLKLGMFDPPEMVKYTKIPYSVVDNKEHHQLALEAAHKSIVLLKNENNLLPLNKNIKTVAVIGPDADETSVLLGNYNGTPSDPVSPLRGIREKLIHSKVLYAQGCGLAEGLSSLKKDSVQKIKQKAIEVAKQSDVVIMCMGLSPNLEGEEMDVAIDGFKGGDRTKLDLPSNQEELIKEIKSLGKPIILVLLNGSAVSINWENKNIPAIIETWYAGQAAGTAIADVLFGDYNPAGRLPVTFYSSVSDLPSFEDYNITTQTYRYFKGNVIYPFGYGLSYTNFHYDNLKINHQNKAGNDVKLSVDIKNTGKVSGDEVVQVYVSNKTSTGHIPIRSLKAFKRIYLKAGETKTLNLIIKPDAFSIINDDNKKIIVHGKFEVSVGGGQPDVKIKTASNVLKAETIIM